MEKIPKKKENIVSNKNPAILSGKGLIKDTTRTEKDFVAELERKYREAHGGLPRPKVRSIEDVIKTGMVEPDRNFSERLVLPTSKYSSLFEKVNRDPGRIIGPVESDLSSAERRFFISNREASAKKLGKVESALPEMPGYQWEKKAALSDSLFGAEDFGEDLSRFEPSEYGTRGGWFRRDPITNRDVLIPTDLLDNAPMKIGTAKDTLSYKLGDLQSVQAGLKKNLELQEIAAKETGVPLGREFIAERNRQISGLQKRIDEIFNISKAKIKYVPEQDLIAPSNAASQISKDIEAAGRQKKYSKFEKKAFSKVQDKWKKILEPLPEDTRRGIYAKLYNKRYPIRDISQAGAGTIEGEIAEKVAGEGFGYRHVLDIRGVTGEQASAENLSREITRRHLQSGAIVGSKGKLEYLHKIGRYNPEMLSEANANILNMGDKVYRIPFTKGEEAFYKSAFPELDDVLGLNFESGISPHLLSSGDRGAILKEMELVKRERNDTLAVEELKKNKKKLARIKKRMKGMSDEEKFEEARRVLRSKSKRLSATRQVRTAMEVDEGLLGMGGEIKPELVETPARGGRQIKSRATKNLPAVYDPVFARSQMVETGVVDSSLAKAASGPKEVGRAASQASRMITGVNEDIKRIALQPDRVPLMLPDYSIPTLPGKTRLDLRVIRSNRPGYEGANHEIEVMLGKKKLGYVPYMGEGGRGSLIEDIASSKKIGAYLEGMGKDPTRYAGEGWWARMTIERETAGGGRSVTPKVPVRGISKGDFGIPSAAKIPLSETMTETGTSGKIVREQKLRFDRRTSMESLSKSLRKNWKGVAMVGAALGAGLYMMSRRNKGTSIRPDSASEDESMYGGAVGNVVEPETMDEGRPYYERRMPSSYTARVSDPNSVATNIRIRGGINKEINYDAVARGIGLQTSRSMGVNKSNINVRVSDDSRRMNEHDISRRIARMV